MVHARLLDRMAAPGPDATIILSGPLWTTGAAFVREWARHTGVEPVWLDAGAGDLTGLGDDGLSTATWSAASGSTVVVRVPPAGSPAGLEGLDRLRERADRLRLIVIAPGQDPAGALAVVTRPDAVITARELCLTSGDLADVVRARGLTLADEELATLFRWSGGYPVAVECLLEVLGDARPTPATFDAAAEALGDRLSGVAAAGVIPREAWQGILLASVPEYFTAPLLEQLVPYGGETSLLQLLDGEGLLHAVDDSRIETTYELAPLVRAALGRRLRLEVEEPERRRATATTVRWLEERHDLAGALAVVTANGTDAAVAQLLAQHWTRLGSLPAGRVRYLLTRLGAVGRADARLLVAHARAVVDITHTAHPGEVGDVERLHAALLLDEAEALSGPTAPGGLDAAIGVLRAVVARGDGDVEGALRRHGELAVAPSPAVAGEVGVAAHLQHCLTLLRVGAFDRAATELDRAEALRAAYPDGCDPAFAAGLARLVRLLGTNRSLPTPERTRGRAETAVPGRLADAMAALHRLDVIAVRELLHRPVGSLGHPPVFGVLAIQLEAVARLVSGVPEAGLESLGLVETTAERVPLTHYERQVLDLVRVELVLADGDAGLALELVDELTPDPHPELPIPLVRAQALVELGQPREAVRILDPYTVGTEGRRHRVWALALMSTVLRAIGDRVEADRHLYRCLALGARSQALLPFARLGGAGFGAILERAAGLDLDPHSREFVAELTRARDSLHLLTRPVRLTERERTLLRHLVHVPSIRRLAAQLYVSPNTVKTQLRSIYRKLGVSSRADALTMSRALGLLPRE